MNEQYFINLIKNKEYDSSIDIENSDDRVTHCYYKKIDGIDYYIIASWRYRNLYIHNILKNGIDILRENNGEV